MSVREQVLTTSQRLLRERHELPSLDEIAKQANVSKGGLLHHFPDRRALVDALLSLAVEGTKRELVAAASAGQQVRRWLQLSVPDGDSVAVAMLVLSSGLSDLPAEVADFGGWCEQLLTASTGDAVLAKVVRLTGDGLFADALTGHRPSDAEVDELVAFFDAVAGASRAHGARR